MKNLQHNTDMNFELILILSQTKLKEVLGTGHQTE